MENKIRHTDEKLNELFLNFNKKFNILRDDVNFFIKDDKSLKYIRRKFNTIRLKLRYTG